jgi:hypothetical protein
MLAGPAPPAPARRLVRGLVPGQDIRGDAAPVGDLDALLTSPCPDAGQVMPRRPRPACTPPGRGHLPCRGNVGTDRLGELIRMLFVQVDLIVGTAKPEPDRTLGLAAVYVIYVEDLCALSH